MELFYLIIFSIIILIFALYLRIKPGLYHKYCGIDNWYWLLCAEKLKETKQIPVRLPYFLLEIEEQWYPPLYPLLLSLFSMNFLKKKSYLISPVIDCLQLLLLYFLTFYFTNSILIAMFASLFYIITPFLISYNTQLNPRCLGSLLFTILMLLFYFYQVNSNQYLLPVMVITGSAILLLHKMTTQLLWYILPALAWIEKDIFYIYFLIGIILLAIVISKGFYLKVLRAHWDIVSFWHRNRNYLMSHQYYESPIYKKESFPSAAFHQKGIKGVLKHIKTISAANPFVIGIVIYGLLNLQNLSDFSLFLFKWSILTYILIGLTTFVPQLRCLGAGVHYIYFSVFPIAYLSIESILQGNLLYPSIFLILSALTIIKIRKIHRQIKTNINYSGINDDTIKVFNYIKKLPEGNIMCIPLFLSDATAYFTKKRVLWGAHGYGFKKLEFFFPVVKMKIEEIIKCHKISYILFDRKYISLGEITGLGNLTSLIYSCGNYTLYKVSVE